MHTILKKTLKVREISVKTFCEIYPLNYGRFRHVMAGLRPPDGKELYYMTIFLKSVTEKD